MGGTPPLLRWAGSKRKLLPKLVHFFEKSKCTDYAEPFCGSACLYFRIQSRTAILSDINSELIESYRQVRKTPEQIYEHVTHLPTTSEFYYELRAKDPASLSSFERAARFLYLNRYSFNGIYRTNRAGQFNVPRGRHTGNFPPLSNFMAVADKLCMAKLIHADFSVALNAITSSHFVYLDPPYVYQKRRDRGEYGVGSFKLPEISRLSGELSRIDSIGAKFLLSYVENEEIADLADRWTVHSVSVRRQIGGFSKTRPPINELLITNIS